VTAKPESELIPAGVDNISKVLSSCTVRSKRDEKVTTVDYLRHGLANELPLDTTDHLAIAEAQRDEIEEHNKRELYVCLYPMPHNHLDTSYPQPQSREQARLLLKDYGWPCSQFRDLKELLLILKGTVKGNFAHSNKSQNWKVLVAQQTLYFKEKTLQRDVSLGNILICPQPGRQFKPTHPCLSDFDCAKKTEHSKSSLLGALKEAASQIFTSEQTMSRALKASESARADFEDETRIRFDPALALMFHQRLTSVALVGETLVEAIRSLNIHDAKQLKEVSEIPWLSIDLVP
jgi:hypothetical protein